MSQYRKRSSSDWTLSSSTLGWTMAGMSLIMVGVFVLGIYLGYDHGHEAGQQQAQLDDFEPDDEFFLNYVRERELSDEVQEELARYFSERTEAPATDERTDRSEEDEFDLSRALTEEDLEGREEGQLTDEPADQPVSDPYERDHPREDEMAEDELMAAVEGPRDDTDDEMISDETVEPENEDRSLAEEFGRTDSFFTIQVLSGPQEQEARRVAEELYARGHRVVVSSVDQEETRLYRVRVGAFDTRDEAEAYARDMTADGEVDDYWVSQVDP